MKGKLKSTMGDNPPKIGERIKVTINKLGYGMVVAYYIEHEYVGVEVKLENPPEWYVKQNGKGSHALVFGAEIEKLEP